MSERGTQLLQTANGQLSELIALVSNRDEADLSVPCPGREKLSDGTVAACASHAADNYLRIAAFVRDGDEQQVEHGQRARGPHRMPAVVRARGHGNGHSPGEHSAPEHAHEVDRRGLAERLSAAGDALGLLADLTDEQLDAVPPASEMKFCDGQRTLQQIVTSLLNHQNHQVEAVKAGLA